MCHYKSGSIKTAKKIDYWTKPIRGFCLDVLMKLVQGDVIRQMKSSGSFEKKKQDLIVKRREECIIQGIKCETTE